MGGCGPSRFRNQVMPICIKSSEKFTVDAVVVRKADEPAKDGLKKEHPMKTNSLLVDCSAPRFAEVNGETGEIPPADVKTMVQESVLSILGRQGYRVEPTARPRKRSRSPVQHIVLRLCDRQIRITACAAERR